MLFFQEFPVWGYDWFFRSGFNYPAVLLCGIVAAFAYGSCLGSFLNVCIWRIPRGESVVSMPSHCTVCGNHIHWYDNLPIISFLVLRGRCRHCRTPYSPRYFIVELITGLLFISVLLKSGLTQQPPGVIVPYCIMVLAAITAAWIDAEHRIIPDLITLPAAVLGVLSAAAFPSVWGVEGHLTAAIHSLLSGGIIAGLLSIFALIGSRIARRDVLGWGDVKFMLAVGTLLGLPGALWTVLAASWGGMIYGIIAARIRRRPMKRITIPFGPFLAAAAVVWIFAGSFLIRLIL